MEFSGWEAAVAAGATLDELARWENNEYPTKFKAKVIAWHNLHLLVKSHQEDAAMPKRTPRKQ